MINKSKKEILAELEDLHKTIKGDIEEHFDDLFAKDEKYAKENEEKDNNQRVLEEVLEMLQTEFFYQKYQISPTLFDELPCYLISGPSLKLRFDCTVKMSSKREKICFEDMQKNAKRAMKPQCMEDLKFFYLRKPPRAEQEILCFESPLMVHGIIGEFDYDDMLTGSRKIMYQRSRYYTVCYQDGYRQRLRKNEENLELAGKKNPYRTAYIPLVPEIAADRKDVRRLFLVPPEAFFRIDCHRFMRFIPITENTIKVLPALIFEIYLNSRCYLEEDGKQNKNVNKKKLSSREYLDKLLKRLTEENTRNYPKKAKERIFHISPFNINEWDFFCFIFNKFCNLRFSFHCSFCIKDKGLCISGDNCFWQGLQKENPSLFEAFRNLISGFDPGETINYLLYRIEQKKSLEPLLRQLKEHMFFSIYYAGAWLGEENDVSNRKEKFLQDRADRLYVDKSHRVNFHKYLGNWFFTENRVF